MAHALMYLVDSDVIAMLDLKVPAVSITLITVLTTPAMVPSVLMELTALVANVYLALQVNCFSFTVFYCVYGTLLLVERHMLKFNMLSLVVSQLYLSKFFCF